jgi:hypothetical protein
MAFKEEHRDYQELVRELILIRRHNLMYAIQVVGADAQMSAKEKRSLVQQQVALILELPRLPERTEQHLLFAEGALVIIALERFLRMILKRTGEENKNVTLQNLLEEATGPKRILRFPAGTYRNKAITDLTLVRNTLLHGNYEQLAREKGCDVRKYFKTQYTPALESLYQLLDHFLKQIDPKTGRPRKPG